MIRSLRRMKREDVRAWLVILTCLAITTALSRWNAGHGPGPRYVALVVAALVTAFLVGMWARKCFLEERHGSRRRHPAAVASLVPPAFTASNGLTVQIVEQQPGFPHLLEVRGDGELLLVTPAPSTSEAFMLRGLAQHGMECEDCGSHRPAFTALDEYLAQLLREVS